LNEYELDLLRQRSVEARREKARRGELLVTAAVGYLKSEEQHWEKDPDRRVQEAVLLVFRKFLELGTARQTLLCYGSCSTICNFLCTPGKERPVGNVLPTQRSTEF
jgi:hypothetical protein